MIINDQSFAIIRSFFEDYPRLDHRITEVFKRRKTVPKEKAIIYSEVSSFVRLLPAYFYSMDRNIFTEMPDSKAIIDAIRDFNPFDYRKTIDEKLKSADVSDWYKTFGLPEFVVQDLLDHHSESEVLIFLKNSILPRPIFARAFKSSVPDELHFESIENIPFAYQYKGKELDFSDDWYQEGWFELQDLSSQMACLLANPKPNQIVMDACAGSGGKSLSMAHVMKGKGKIISVSTNEFDKNEIKKRYSRLKLGNIVALDFNDPKINAFASQCDIVWIDAPCSGSGVIRRNPDIIYRLQNTDFGLITKKQQELLNTYQSYLKPGGRLIYSTCSVLSNENSEVINKFLTENKNYTFADHAAAVSYFKLPVSSQNEFFWGFSNQPNMDGFYFTVLKKEN